MKHFNADVAESTMVGLIMNNTSEEKVDGICDGDSY